MEGPPEWLSAMAFGVCIMGMLTLIATRAPRWTIAAIAFFAGMNLTALLG